jgi:hypothetical protein
MVRYMARRGCPHYQRYLAVIASKTIPQELQTTHHKDSDSQVTGMSYTKMPYYKKGPPTKTLSSLWKRPVTVIPTDPWVVLYKSGSYHSLAVGPLLLIPGLD